MIDSDYDRMIAPPRRGWAGPLIFGLVAFVAGIVAMAYLVGHWEAGRRYLLGAQAPDPAAATRPPAAQAQPRPQPMLASPLANDVATRIIHVERRLEQIDERASAASGNADRAEGLLVAFAARRALDRGQQLGYVESLLRQRFGANQPQAIATILSAARQPVTLASLRTDFDEIAPRLALRGPGEGWWAGLRRELASLVVVRKADMASAAPADRVTRARLALESGNVETALAEVSRLASRSDADPWMAEARRYIQARNALDTIETAALLQPRAE